MAELYSESYSCFDKFWIFLAHCGILLEQIKSMIILGDYADESKDPKKLLGFSEDLKVAQMGGGVKYKFDILCGTEKLIDHIRQLERKLHLEPKQPLLLRGFENNYAKFDYGESQLSCKVCDYQQESHPL